MHSGHAFKIALVISLAIHGTLLLQKLHLVLTSQQKQEKKLELQYVKSPKPDEEKSLRSTPIKRKEPLYKLPARISSRENVAPPYADEKLTFAQKKEIAPPSGLINKPVFTKPEVVALKKKVHMPALEMNKMNNPSYLSYYQIVREKIRRTAYQNYIIEEQGGVRLSFVISDDGSLKEVRVDEDASAANPRLTEISLKSIKDASPFPDFPKELNFPQLSFNVIISYEIE